MTDDLDPNEPMSWSGRNLPGMPLWAGPQAIRDEFLRAFGHEWTASYLDPSGWIPQMRQIVPRHSFAHDKIVERAGGKIIELGLKLFRPAKSHRTLQP